MATYTRSLRGRHRLAVGRCAITAAYAYEADGDDAADTWLVYLKEGSDPDPTTDSPDHTEDMSKTDGLAVLEHTTGYYDHGTDLHVLVRTRRSGSPDVDSDNTAASTITIDASRPASPAAHAFLDERVTNE